MADARKLLEGLIEELAAAEQGLLAARFLAPCVAGCRVRTRVLGLVHTFRPRPPDFEGWGLFRPIGGEEAQLDGVADLPLVAEYLRLLRPLRLLLAHPLRQGTWLAYPANESDARQRIGSARPRVLHLVTEGTQFEQVVARWDGDAWWFEETDRRADPQLAETLRGRLREAVPPEELRVPGLTPEARTTYDLAAQQAKQFFAQMQARRDHGRLETALRQAGGQLRDFRNRGEYWVVEWETSDGRRHTSAISRDQLAVVSAGICLSGRDADFDLQSLVGVMAGAEVRDW